MRQKLQNNTAEEKQQRRSLVDIVSALMVCLFPVVSGAILLRVYHMGGAPAWFTVFQGMIFLGSLGQTVYFLAFGLIRALRQSRKHEDR